eukprot:gene15044-biopygen12626
MLKPHNLCAVRAAGTGAAKATGMRMHRGASAIDGTRHRWGYYHHRWGYYQHRWGYYQHRGATTSIVGLLPASWGYYQHRGATTSTDGASSGGRATNSPAPRRWRGSRVELINELLLKQKSIPS